MDAFALACAFAGFDPGYFYHSMGLDEFEAVCHVWRESWEKTRLAVVAAGGKMKLPWDNENILDVKYNKEERAVLATDLSEKLKERVWRTINSK